jgi:hypothetical protein
MTDVMRKQGQLIAKAWTDPAFMTRLKKDPKSALKEVGLDAPAGTTIEVLESTPQRTYLVIPPKPTGELSDQALDKISGGDYVSKVDSITGCCC